MYWAQEIANQDEDPGLKKIFQIVAKSLEDNEAKIVDELNSVQGKPVDIKGYYNASEDRIFEVMRPSETLNGIIQTMLS